jgi:hypothetical protein
MLHWRQLQLEILRHVMGLFLPSGLPSHCNEGRPAQRREVIPMLIVAFIGAAAALITLVAFVAVVLAIHATERRYELRRRGLGRTDRLTRRLLGVYTDPPRTDSRSAEYEYTRR